MSDENFNDLYLYEKQLLLEYIEEHFIKCPNINYTDTYTAQNLKQLVFADRKTNITNKCFMEAMIQSGYKAQLVGDSDWCFNAIFAKCQPI